MVSNGAEGESERRLKKEPTKVWAAGTAEGIAEVAIAAGTICRFHLARSRRSTFESELLLIVVRHFLAHFVDL
jgi:hypothetical protein